jgi:UDP-N-acetylmuramoyl-tripeptide--D-alanyl-D-alanine ligase
MVLDELFLKDILHAQVLFGIAPQTPYFSIDTRTLNQGDIFVALSGATTDGHQYINEAIQKGASGLIIDSAKKEFLSMIDSKTLATLFIIVVQNPYEALFKIAASWRKRFSYPVIGITGSVGKTSTRELCAQIFDAHNIKYVATRDNENSALGVALTLLKMRDQHQVALVEMGVSKRGEMKQLAYMVQPTIGVITAIGHSHMEGLGSVTNIAAEKRDIFAYFKENNIGIINGDQSHLTNVAYKHPVIKVGKKTTNQIQARKIQEHKDDIQFILKIYGKKYSVALHTNHHGRIMNALTATAVAHLLNVPEDIVVNTIQKPCIVSGRFEAKKLKNGNGLIINDCYNANPESMKAALLAFQNMNTRGKKIAVLGDMLELGTNSPFWHRQLGRFLRKVPSLNHLVLVGDMVEWTKKTVPLGLKVDIAPTWQAAAILLAEKIDKEAVVLVKGSRNIGLTNLVNQFSSEI